MWLFLIVALICLIIYAVIKGLRSHARNKEQANDIRDIMWRAEHGGEAECGEKQEAVSPYAPSKLKDNLKSAKKMTVAGAILAVCGTISAIYGNYKNNHVNTQRVYDAARDLWYNGAVTRDPGDPFFIAGLVALGVGAVLLIGGIAWTILTKNKELP